MRNKENREFRQLRTKLLLRTVVMLLVVVSVIYTISSVRQKGTFTRLAVSFFQTILGMDYGTALELYQRGIRDHADAFIMLAIVLVFVGLFLGYLHGFTRYFTGISRGMDALVQEETGEISLPPELVSIERKMNAAKHIFVQQKSEMALAQEWKNDLVMYLAHDLKTPLASVISYLNLLRDEKQISEELREKYLAISLDKAERLEDLINEFLEIAKFNLSDITLQYRKINLTRLLEQLVYESQPVLKDRGLSCRLSVAEDIFLDCDADKMQRVFDNLLRNAAIYSVPESEIVIQAETAGDMLTVTFINHGDTIPEDKLERIFEQFYRLDSGRSSGGAGLGLAIARQIVTLHKGTLTAQSAQDTTTFLVKLPLRREIV